MGGINSPTTLAANSVNTTQIVDGAVTTPKIAARNVTPALLSLKTVTAKVAGFNITNADYETLFVCTGSFTITFDAAATLASGFYCRIVNIGTGTITLDPNGAEKIIIPGGTNTGDTTITLPYSGSTGGLYNTIGVTIFSDGAQLICVDTDSVHGAQLFTGSGTFNVPQGVTTVFLTGVAGGGGAGGTAATATAMSGSGGGGGATVRQAITTTPGAAVTVTIGGGGAGGSANNPGATGGSTSFGASLTLTGGGGGGQVAAGSGVGGTAGAGGSGGNISGNPGQKGDNVPSTTLTFIKGGGSPWGEGGSYQFTAGTNGIAGTGLGSGGGGANPAAATNQTGGNGTGGFLLVEW